MELLLKDKMGLRMKNFDILHLHWKIWLLGGEFMKNQYRGGEGGCLKRGLGQFADLRGLAWQERGGSVFEGGWYLDAHYNEA